MEKQMVDDLIEIFNEEYEKKRLITPQNTAEKLVAKGYRKQIEGHWFIVEYEFFTCSECNYGYYNGCSSTRQAKERLTRGCYPNFCPDCGAKMKGGDE